MPPACGLLINTLEEGEKLADALGDKRGVLIRNHGVVVVGESVPRVVYSSVTLRDSAKILLSTLAMGVEPHYIGREEAEQGTYVQFCGQGLQRSWNYWCQKAKQTFPDIAELEH
jgi:ribulose-5-phosphate 4-epimerase/fuculose-1-phosphate aldolase